MSDLRELAKRVEATTWPDRELDLRIEAAINPEYAGLDEEHARFLTRYGGHPSYTASLDAAMTLVPEGWHVGMLTECDEDNSPIACLTENEEPCRDVVGKGVNMTLSLVAAALRAREEDRG